MTVFVDSSVWLAAVFEKDAQNARADEIRDEASSGLVTTHHGFLIYRYGTNRDRAFEVLR